MSVVLELILLEYCELIVSAVVYCLLCNFSENNQQADDELDRNHSSALVLK